MDAVRLAADQRARPGPGVPLLPRAVPPTAWWQWQGGAAHQCAPDLVRRRRLVLDRHRVTAGSAAYAEWSVRLPGAWFRARPAWASPRSTAPTSCADEVAG
ncbi:hypothetical protein QJS66_22835 [Kocuria rhizophila]|nr:hypothetical protein QJS66_22835 [Kocuria rhizophila]